MVARRTIARTGLAPVPLVIVVALATLALALMTIGIKDSQVPVQASQFEEHDDCDFPGSPSQSPPLWGWHFVLPGGEATFVSLTATFEDAGEVTLPGPSGSFVQDGKGAVIYTPTDDTLVDATAEIEGETPQGYFVLSHTCLPAPESESPTPSVSSTATPSESASGTPSASVSGTATATPSESVSASASESPSAEVSGTVLTSSPAESASESVSPTVLGVRQTRGGVGGVSLPTTGSTIVPLLAIGLLLVATGVALACRPRGRYAR